MHSTVAGVGLSRTRVEGVAGPHGSGPASARVRGASAPPAGKPQPDAPQQRPMSQPTGTDGGGDLGGPSSTGLGALA